MKTRGHISNVRLNALLAIAVFVLAFAAVSWRIDKAPDINYDELVYTRVGMGVASQGSLASDEGQAFFVHPSLYFLAVGGFLATTYGAVPQEPTTEDMFELVHHVRYVNAIFAGLTAAVLYLLGSSLRNTGLGLFIATLFILDPFGLSSNRRCMLETMAAMLALAGMTLLIASLAKSKGRPGVLKPHVAVLAGFVFGGALLSKELTFTFVLAVLIYAAIATWRKQHTIGYRLLPFLPIIVLVTFYLIFPLWAVALGQLDRFFGVKLTLLERLLGIVTYAGWNRPGVSLFDFLIYRLGTYFTSYLVLGLGGLSTLFLVANWKHQEAAGRLVTVWSALQYLFYSYIAVAGAGHPQFFYFLLVSSVVSIGYAASIFPEVLRLRNPAESRLVRRLAYERRGGVISGITVPMILILVLVLPFNVYRWITNYGVGTDDGFHRLTSYINTHVPPEEFINTSGLPIMYNYLLPNYVITTASTPLQAAEMRVHYFVHLPKDLWARYGQTTEELASWLGREAQEVFSANDFSYGNIFLFHMNYPDTSAAPLSDSELAALYEENVHELPTPLSQEPAPVGWLLLFVAAWLVAIVAWTVWLCSRRYGFSYAPLKRQSSDADSGR